MRVWVTMATVGVLVGGLVGCGYVGDPLPPALKIPRPVEDLAAEQVGEYLEVKFTLPVETLEGIAIRETGKVELLLSEQWPEGGETVEVAQGITNPKVAVEKWAGKEVTLGVRVASVKGRFSPWSNLVKLKVESPVAKVAEVKAEAKAEGVELRWEGKAEAGLEWRVLRVANVKGVLDKEPVELAKVKEPLYLDRGAEFGGRYRYTVEGLRGAARSGMSEAVEIEPVDRFAPAAPEGLTALNGATAVELSWERGTEPDLAYFRVYRAALGKDWEVLAAKQTQATYSDSKVKSGERWRYAVSALDQNGNESKKSNEVEVNIP